MKTKHRVAITAAAILALLGGIACPKPPATPVSQAQGSEPAAQPAITNRIDVPAAVRKNLGITYVKVERRAVGETLLVRGQFEYAENAHRDVHTLIGGRVAMLVAPYQSVQAGSVVARVHTPSWAPVRHAIADAYVEIDLAKSALAIAESRKNETAAEADVVARGQTIFETREKAHVAHRAALEAVVAVLTDRETELKAMMAGGAGMSSQLAEIRASIAKTKAELAELLEVDAEIEADRQAVEIEAARLKNQLPRLDAEILAAKAAVTAAESKLKNQLEAGAMQFGYSVADLLATVPAGNKAVPRWQVLNELEIVAPVTGVVESIAVTDGAIVADGAVLLRILDGTQLRFRAAAFQAHLGTLAAGTRIKIVPPDGATLVNAVEITGSLAFGLHADPRERTIDLLAHAPLNDGEALPSWARAGVGGFMEINLGGRDSGGLAIPLRAVISDGLDRVFFRRDPQNPDKVIRVVGDFGTSDGRYIIVESGVNSGDEIVLDGVYELKLASSSMQNMKGGHFHADGTWHAGADH